MFHLALFTLLALLTLLPSSLALPRFHVSSPSMRGTALQKSAFLNAHNTVRAAHGAPDLTWSYSLASLAEKWADSCQFSHSGGTLRPEPYGENLAAATGNFPISTAVNLFAQDGAATFNVATPTYTPFTQVVWKSTTQLGCAVSECNNIFDPSFGSALYYVCLYDPAGNVVGQAPANVQV